MWTVECALVPDVWQELGILQNCRYKDAIKMKQRTFCGHLDWLRQSQLVLSGLFFSYFLRV